MRRPLSERVLAAALGLVAPALLLVVLGSTSHASVQECNTRCQITQTDCTLACDGDRACIRRCSEAARTCVQTCARSAGYGDAGPGDGGDAGDGGKRP